MTQSSGRARLLLAAAMLCALVSLACFAVPLYVVRPFRHQGPTELSVALFVTRIGPWVSLVCAMLCVVLVIFTWLRARGWIVRAAAVSALLVALCGATLSRVNIYEQMFHPVGAPQFESADRAKLAPDEMVIAIRVHNQSRAYPIREMAYHHVVNDTVAGERVVATY